MAFTRFHDDPCRIQKYLEETTNIGNYGISVPGNGLNLRLRPFGSVQKPVGRERWEIENWWYV